jgi:putative addiction module component (TIGR02574 family)
MDLASALSAVRSLSIEDRLRLVETIQHELVPELTEEQQRELELRLAEDDADPDDVVSWEVIKKEAQARRAKGLGGVTGGIRS